MSDVVLAVIVVAVSAVICLYGARVLRRLYRIFREQERKRAKML